ncbi:MAG: hypothetical protein FWE18_04895 [Alphaproteobacteria bacterium]|nr:hypothetical protein [Alphaproteobacteria bacterium]
MIRFFISIFICLFVFSTAEASLFRDNIFIGKNKEKYSYFFSITEFTSIKDIEQKLRSKKFSLKKNTKLLVILEMPNNLSSSKQEALWVQLGDLKTSFNNTPYHFITKFNGIVDKNLSMYVVHLYYK